MPTRVRSFSKINLGLAVGPARGDGFHGLTTVYQTLGLHDVVTVTAQRAGKTELRLTSDSPRVPTDSRNTAWKMVEGALARMGVAAEVEIAIEKRLPVQGGLGAGSANAVAALLGLERELGVFLGCEERLKLAAEVGSDVPLFLVGGTILGVGRGEEVYALPDFAGLACVVAVPEVGVSTAAAFRELDQRQGLGIRDQGLENAAVLTLGSTVDKLKELSCALAGVCVTGVERSSSGIARTIRPEQDSGDLPDGRALQMRDVEGDLAESPTLALVRTGIENDFEEVVFSQHPSLRSIKRELLGSGTSGGAVYAALSGSGSALFGLFGSEADARAAQQRVQQAGTRAILTETLSRAAYWQTMFAE